MDNNPLPVRVFGVPFALLCVAGITLGFMVGAGFSPYFEKKTDILFFGAGGLLLSLMVALWPRSGVIYRLLQAWLPERFDTYESSMSLPTMEEKSNEPEIILIDIPDLGITYRLHRCGIPLADWQKVAREAVKQGKYTTDMFEFIFQSQKIGRQNYGIMSGPLESAGVLVKYKTGYNITDHIGVTFFKRLERGDWRVLYQVPEGMEAMDV
jgi:hypothetical protein